MVPSSAHRPQLGWHLITEDGALTARLHSGLTVGVDDQGLLRFNPGEAALLRFSGDSEGSLVVEAADDQALLRADTGEAARSTTLEAGQAGRVRLEALTIVLATDVVSAGHRPDAVELSLTPRPAAAPEAAHAPEPQPEPATEPEPTKQPEPATRPEPKPATEPEPRRVPTLTQQVHRRIDPDGPRQRRRLNAGIALFAGFALVLAISPRVRDALQPTRAAPPAARPLEQTPSAPAAGAQERSSPADSTGPGLSTGPAAAGPAATEAVGTTAVATPPAGTPPVGTPGEDDDGAPAVAGSVDRQAEPPRSAAAPPRPADRRLELARRLLEQEDVITPPGRNAVELLSAVLYDDPDNAEALTLMQQSADALVADAERALVRGDDYAARNLIEDVLAFHPTHVDARALWQQLTGTPAP